MLTIHSFLKTIGLLILFVCLTPLHGLAQGEDTAIQVSFSFAGKWEVVYEDDRLGMVSGLATVAPDEGSVEVELKHLRTGAVHRLSSSSLMRTNDGFEIVLEGRSPRSEYQDGRGYPQIDLVVPENIQTFKVKVGDNEVSRALAPRKPSDLDRVSLKLSICDDYLEGTWSYRADPVTVRDREGYGRVGRFTMQEDGSGLQTGCEIWRRPVLEIEGALTLENQRGNLHGVPHMPYPFQKGMDRTRGAHRTLFIWGKNLPRDQSEGRAVFESLSPHITYSNVRYMSEANRSPYPGDDFKAGVKKLEKLLAGLPPECKEDTADYDFILVTAGLRQGVVPGYHTFTLNGVSYTWKLSFGDNHAAIDFVREVPGDNTDPRGVPPAEIVADLFLPEKEAVRVEVRTALNLNVEEINVRVRRNGQDLKFGEDTVIPARRLPADPRVYRTEKIRIVRQGPEVITGPPYMVTTPIGAVFSASITQPGLISFEPTPAKAKVHRSPDAIDVDYLGSGKVSMLWHRYLIQAAACHGIAYEGWDNMTPRRVAEVGSYAIHLNPVALARAGSESKGGRIDWLHTDIQLGDHAAMMMLREMFIQMMLQRMNEFQRIMEDKDDKSVIDFRQKVEPYVWLADYGVGKVTVKGRDGSAIPFWASFDVDPIDDEYYRHMTPEKRWSLNATREAIAGYIEIMRQAVKIVEDIDPCDDIEALLRMTGNCFENVVHKLRPRLLRIEALQTAPGGMAEPAWAPDYIARAYLDRIAILLDQVRRNEVVAARDDSAKIMLAGAMASLPVMVFGGPVGMVVGLVVEAANLGLLVHGEVDHAWNSQSEMEFAEKAIAVLGEQRFRQAQQEEYAWLSAATMIFLQSGLDVFGVDELSTATKAIKAWKVGNLVRRLDTGKRVLKAVLRRDGHDFFKGMNEVVNEIVHGTAQGMDDALPLSIQKSHRGTEAVLSLHEYLKHAVRLRIVGTTLDDPQLLGLKAFEGSDLGRVVFSKRAPSWATRVDPATMGDLSGMLHRVDIHELMQDAAEIVNRDLRAGGRTREETLKVLKTSPQRNRAQYQRALENRLKIKPGHFTADYMNQSARDNTKIRHRLYNNKWHINSIVGNNDNKITIFVVDPNYNRASIERGYEASTGTFSMYNAFREDVGKWISDIDWDVPLHPTKGVPTIQFMTLRIMKMFDIGFAGTGPNILKTVRMMHITNAHTIVQAHWLRDMYFPGKTLMELADNPEFGMLLQETRSVQYARGVMEKAGYQIDGPVRIRTDDWWNNSDTTVGRAMEDYKADGPGEEDAAAFIKRYGVSTRRPVKRYFILEFDVKPIDPNSPSARPATSNNRPAAVKRILLGNMRPRFDMPLTLMGYATRDGKNGPSVDFPGYEQKTCGESLSIDFTMNTWTMMSRKGAGHADEKIPLNYANNLPFYSCFESLCG